MYTPQQIQEQTFSRAVFGGYDMEQVDAFLEPLTEDYIELYKENAVLKSKMKFLVEKLEELRGTHAGDKDAEAETRAACDRMLAETRKKCAEMTANAEKQCEEKNALNEEELRLSYAKQTALNFIDVIEADIKSHLELLESLKHRDLTVAQEETAPVREKPYDWSEHEPVSSGTPQSIADEISESLEKIVGTEDETAAAAEPHHVESPTRPYRNLQFGKNYDPTSADTE